MFTALDANPGAPARRSIVDTEISFTPDTARSWNVSCAGLQRLAAQQANHRFTAHKCAQFVCPLSPGLRLPQEALFSSRHKNQLHHRRTPKRVLPSLAGPPLAHPSRTVRIFSYFHEALPCNRRAPANKQPIAIPLPHACPRAHHQHTRQSRTPLARLQAYSLRPSPAHLPSQ
jgi:hypothetical protein